MISKQLVLEIIRKYKRKYMYQSFIYQALTGLENEIDNEKGE